MNGETPTTARTIKELMLYKVDRTLAIVGLSAVTITALILGHKEVASMGVGGLAAYIGGKVSK